MNNRIRDMIDRVAFLLGDGKIPGDDAFTLMEGLAKLDGEMQAEMSMAYARERYAQADDTRKAKA